MDNQSAGRIHYGRLDTRSGSPSDSDAYSNDSREPARPTPSWYGGAQPEESPAVTRERENIRRNASASVWDESKSTRIRPANQQGTARDARRIQQRHARQSRRTPNRNTVYNTGGSQEEIDMFQAVASGDHMDHQPYRRTHSNMGGINSKGSWHSSSATSYPALRNHHRNDMVRIALPVVLVVLAVIAIALGIHSCVSA